MGEEVLGRISIKKVMRGDNQENVGKSVYAFFEQGKWSLAGHSEMWEGLLYIF